MTQKLDVPICQDDQRRDKVRHSGYNGFDYLEVDLEKQKLTVYLLAKLENPDDLTPKHFLIHGGQRGREVRIIKVKVCTPPDPRIDDCIELTFDKPGDYSTYTLCIVELDEDRHPTGRPYPGFDRRYHCLDFSFAVDCHSDLDCRTAEICPVEEREEPEINYLAKDYASFRRLILDRLALIMPDWQDRHVPDLGVTLVELLAYTGDYLSYYQDAVATEAYLDTARRRISVRRHARLVDYRMHEGCNARAWLCITVDNPVVELDPADITFITTQKGYGSVISYFDDFEELAPGSFEAFSPLLPGREDENAQYQVQPYHQRWISEPLSSPPKIILRQAHNCLRFYTWGDEECCLPRGATGAWLVDTGAKPKQKKNGKDQVDPKQQAVQEKPDQEDNPQDPGPRDYDWSIALRPGDFLLLEEVLGPQTGVGADADPAHRHVVRLTSVRYEIDPLYKTDEHPYGAPVVYIAWAPEDALPFPLCLSVPGRPPECEPIGDVSTACGNVILVDHGRPVPEEDLGCVSGDCIPGECLCGYPGDVHYHPRLFRPQLARQSLLFRQPLPTGDVPASLLLGQDPRLALPAIRLLAFADPECDPLKSTAASEPEPVVQQTAPDKGSPDQATAASGDPKQQSQTVAPDQNENAQDSDLEPIAAERWHAQYDLLDSYAASRHFVAEVDSEGFAHLRFGDGNSGQQPAAHQRFLASYTTGGGPEGNVGAETITHMVYAQDRPAGIRSLRNPLPATGGMAAEPIAEVKMFAPQAFRTRLERAILAEDYAAIVLRDFASRVQHASAELHWTGSGYEVLVAVDALGGTEPSAALLNEIKEHLGRYRRIGHDLRVRPAIQAGLVIAMEVCAAPDFLKGHVKAALLDMFGSRVLPNGDPGFFHPDRLIPGQDIYLSELVAAAQKTPGVLSATVTELRRYGDPHDPTGAIPDEAVASGILRLGPLEVARLDNNPARPEYGRLTLVMEGGR